MIGNDVVDLRDPEAGAEARHPGFDARVFTPAERAALAASATPERLRWQLWAAKEAAYKLLKKRDPRCVFSPRRFAVSLREGGSADVAHADVRVRVGFDPSADFVHAVATDGDLSPARLRVGVRRLPSAAGAAPDAPGRAVRQLAVSALRDVWPTAASVRIGRAGRVPVVEVDGVRADADLSLSHHGRWVAFACELPRAEAERR